jgi:hypothetical protein
MQHPDVLTYSTSIAMIDRERKPWQQWNDDTTFPRGAFAVRPNDAVNQSISNSVLDFNVADHSAAKIIAGNEEN